MTLKLLSTILISLTKLNLLPIKKTQEASGYDVLANNLISIYRGTEEINKDKLEVLKKSFEERGFINLRGHERALIGTGIFLKDIDKDLEIQVRPRSGLSLKRGIFIANSPGTIDSDYRGEICIIVYNSTPFLNSIKKEEAIAQLVFQKVEKNIEFNISEKIRETERNDKGFGSTDKKV